MNYSQFTNKNNTFFSFTIWCNCSFSSHWVQLSVYGAKPCFTCDANVNFGNSINWSPKEVSYYGQTLDHNAKECYVLKWNKYLYSVTIVGPTYILSLESRGKVKLFDTISSSTTVSGRRRTDDRKVKPYALNSKYSSSISLITSNSCYIVGPY